jgi:hypothetical protein
MRVWLACMTALVGCPMTTSATELDSGVLSELHWTDNVYSETIEEVEDYSTRIAPWAELADPDGEVTWRLRYSPAYEYYLDEDDLNGLDHAAEAHGAWRISGATTLRVEDRFQRYNSISRFNEQSAPGEDVIVAGRRIEYTSNRFGTSLEHLLSPRDVLLLNATYLTRRFSEEGQGNRDAYGASALYRHRWTERTNVGAVLSWNRQVVEQVDLDDRQTDYFNLSALYTYEFSPSLHFEVSAGPALILSDALDTSIPPTVRRFDFPSFQRTDGFHLIDADSCPRNNAGMRILDATCQTLSPALTPFQASQVRATQIDIPVVGDIPSPDDSNTTYFANVSLSKSWRTVRGVLSYRRSEDLSTGFGAVSDNFYGTLIWQVTPRFSATLAASYELLEQGTESLGLATTVSNEPSPFPAQFPLAAQTQGVNAVLLSRDIGLDVIVTRLRMTYALSRRSTVYSDFIYRDETTDGDVFQVRDMQRLGISFGINFAFDPIEL